MNAAGPAPLDFRLRTPVRLGWASEAARARWAPRFAEMRAALEAFDPQSHLAVVRADRARALRAAVARAGQEARPLTDDALGAEPFPAGGAVVILATGARALVEAIAAAAAARDARALAAATGLPACCLEAAWRASAVDKEWLRAAPPADALEVDLPPRRETNALLRPLGLRAAPVPPCGGACEAMYGFVRARLDRLAGDEHAAAIALLESALDWPVRWSALHGIAETVTPVVRFTYGTLATGRRIVARYHGETMPEDAAQGLAFPYRLPARLRASAGA